MSSVSASAVAWMLFLIIVLIGLVNFAIARRIASADSADGRRRRRGRSPAADPPSSADVAPVLSVPAERQP